VGREVWVLEQVGPNRQQKYTGTLSDIIRVIENKITGKKEEKQTN
jgi:hypothetical protein